MLEPPLRRTLIESLVGALLIATVCTFFDWLWREYIPPEHSLVYGLAHGALLFTVLGGYLGLSAHKLVRGALGGLAVGFLSAGSFYAYFLGLELVMARRTAYSAGLLLSWLTLWVLLAALERHLAGQRPALPALLGRGLLVAVVSVPGFGLILPLWANPADFCYPCAFGAWTLAFFLALFALLARRSEA